VKEHLAAGLSEGDRAALQSLVPLAGALGAGTIFALFSSKGRRTGFAIFEIFAIVAVLTAVGTTAYLAIALIHRNLPIHDRDLTQTATPLIVAAFLLVFISIFNRVATFSGRALTIAVLLLGAAVVAIEVSMSSWSASPGGASLFALLMLAVGLLLGAIGWAVDRDHDRRAAAGYLPAAEYLRPLLPANPDQPTPALACWRRKDRLYFDLDEAERLRRTVNARWGALAAGEARPATGTEILFRVKVGYCLPGRRDAVAVAVVAFEPAAGGREVVHELPRNAHGLFEVTPFVQAQGPSPPSRSGSIRRM
jgi:hypothetical protein